MWDAPERLALRVWDTPHACDEYRGWKVNLPQPYTHTPAGTQILRECLLGRPARDAGPGGAPASTVAAKTVVTGPWWPGLTRGALA